MRGVSVLLLLTVILSVLAITLVAGVFFVRESRLSMDKGKVLSAHPLIMISKESANYRRQYCTQSELSRERLATIPQGQNSRNSIERYGEKLNEQGIVVASKLLQVPGTLELTFDVYCVKVEKADSFNWEEMEPKIVTALSEVLGTQK